MPNINYLLCALRTNQKRREEKIKVGRDKKEDLHKFLNMTAKEFETGIDSKTGKTKWENIRDLEYNDTANFQEAWLRYVGEPFEPSSIPISFSDIKKFRLGLGEWNRALAREQSGKTAWGGASWTMLPKRLMDRYPEARKFSQDLSMENGFFKDFMQTNNGHAAEFLKNWDSFALSLGEQGIMSKIKTKAGKMLLKSGKHRHKLLTIQNTIHKSLKVLRTGGLDQKTRQAAALAYNEAKKEMRTFYDEGAGTAYKYMTQTIEGARIETITDANGKPLTITQKQHLRQMRKSMIDIRKAGLTSLIRGTEMVIKLNKDTDNSIYVNKTVEQLRDIVKQLEFDKINEDGLTIDAHHFKATNELLEYGWVPGKGGDKVESGQFKAHVSLKKYIPKYTLGVVETINFMVDKSTSLEGLTGKDKLRIDSEIQEHTNLINRLRGRNPMRDDIYNLDPHFFLKKYINDVGTFNYRTHVLSSFTELSRKLVNDHLTKAELKGRDDLARVGETALGVMRATAEQIALFEPKAAGAKGYAHDIMRTLSAVQYFRLLGMNWRSGIRNATQRFYEFQMYGAQAKKDAYDWYNSNPNSKEHKRMADEALKKYGYQWYESNNSISRIWQSVTGEKSMDLSTESRGALLESISSDRSLLQTKDGEFVLNKRRWTETIAAAAETVASKSAFMHKLVEDRNRSATYKNAFSLLYQNLELLPRDFHAKDILKDPKATAVDLQNKYGLKTQEVLNKHIEKRAGIGAHQEVELLHFDYAKWAKAKPLKKGIGPLAFQFKHYQQNMFDLQYEVARDAIRGATTGDFTGQEVWKGIRYGLLHSTASAIGLIGRVGITGLFANEIYQNLEKFYWITFADRDDPEDVKMLEEVTYGMGGWGEAGPTAGYAIAVAEYFDFLDFHDEDVRSPVEGAFKSRYDWNAAIEQMGLEVDDARVKQYKAYALINSQLARSKNYTLPLFEKRGFFDALKFETGLMPSKAQRETRKWYEKKLGLRDLEVSPDPIRPYENTEKILDTLNTQF